MSYLCLPRLTYLNAVIDETMRLFPVAATGSARRREINHPHAIGGPVPVAYTAARLGDSGPTLALNTAGWMFP